MLDTFKKYPLVVEDSFKNLSSDIFFEDVIPGRQGAVLVSPKDESIPIVRTTTKYKKPVQRFTKNHYDLIGKIRDKVKEDIGMDLSFNNALIEIYDSRYRSMGYHSDQALDLADNSYICIFSCYSKNTKSLRKLVVKKKKEDPKDPKDQEETEIILDHNSIVLFSTETNDQYLHKIIIGKDCNDDTEEDSVKWLGITFRLSKTFVKFVNGVPYLNNNEVLTLANDQERKEYYKCRSQENGRIGYKYPEINYTISESDGMCMCII
jgi:hypothetical protein